MYCNNTDNPGFFNIMDCDCTDNTEHPSYDCTANTEHPSYDCTDDTQHT